MSEMKGWFRNSGWALICSVIFFSISCGDSAATCTFDSDCFGDQLCVESHCTNVCASDEDCQSFQSCQAFLRPEDSDPVQVCMGEEPLHNNEQCTDHGDCRLILGDEAAICGVGQRCVIPLPGEETRHYGFLIRDKSTPAEPGEPEGEEPEPWLGLELLDVFVEDAQGVVIGFGTTLSYFPARNLGILPHLDASRPGLIDDGQCVADIEIAPRTPLGGQDGYYLIGFIDGAGAPLALDETMRAVVLAAGPGCGYEGSATIEYDAFFCVLEEDRPMDVGTDCGIHAGEGTPVRREFQVTGL
ncbi:MAG: hypothetical protein ACNA8W_20520 [Bradymonadaceae bacterium]